MRLRFEIQSIYSLGSGTHRLPINCWRLTVLYQKFPGSFSGAVLLDGVSLAADLLDNPATNTFHLARFVVGGVLLPNGVPVNLDQVLIISSDSTTKSSAGVLIYEYLEP